MYRDDLELSIQGDTFAAMKEDFDQMLTELLNNMEEKGASESTLTLKLGIKLVPTAVSAYGGLRDAVLPVFKHDISSVMTVKNKISGIVGNGMELVYDKATGDYALRKIEDGQMRFDTDGNIIDNMAEEDDDSEDEEDDEGESRYDYQESEE